MTLPEVPPIDPTKNVLETIEAAVRRQDDLRDAESKLQDAKRTGEIGRIEQRLDDDRYYGREIARMLAKSVVDTSALLSKQVEQTQTGLNVRVTELEKSRYEIGGKSAGFQASWGVIVAAVAAGGVIVSAIGGIFSLLGKVTLGAG